MMPNALALLSYLICYLDMILSQAIYQRINTKELRLYLDSYSALVIE